MIKYYLHKFANNDKKINKMLKQLNKDIEKYLKKF